MSEKDLMVGDWVNVVPFHNKKNSYFKRVGNGNDIDRLFDFQGHIEPIPITPEILEKNGFDQYYDADAGYIDEFSYSGIKIKIKEKMCWLRSYLPYPLPEKYIIPCEYVHELQHALRLCNIDKDIEL